MKGKKRKVKKIKWKEKKNKKLAFKILLLYGIQFKNGGRVIAFIQTRLNMFLYLFLCSTSTKNHTQSFFLPTHTAIVSFALAISGTPYLMRTLFNIQLVYFPKSKYAEPFTYTCSHRIHIPRRTVQSYTPIHLR